MSYRFEGNESAADAVERVALEQLDKALEHTNAKTKLDAAVHDVRVCFKKLRGLIRLVRDEVGDKLYKRENIFYRDLNRHLSEVRDTAALTEILGKLEERFAEELTDNAFASFRRSLTRAAGKRQTEKKKALAQVRNNIIAARERVKRWPIKDDHFSVVGPGLKQIYSQGRAGFGKAYEKQSVRAFHEWRKDVKYFWYHLRFLRPLWPKELKRFAKQVERLVDLLSDDHDLALLRDRVLDASKHSPEAQVDELLLALIEKRRAELETKARYLGERIYAEKPDAFENRFHEYWKAWRAEQDVNPTVANFRL
jgi:CHAD domain-containing protein